MCLGVEMGVRGTLVRRFHVLVNPGRDMSKPLDILVEHDLNVLRDAAGHLRRTYREVFPDWASAKVNRAVKYCLALSTRQLHPVSVHAPDDEESDESLFRFFVVLTNDHGLRMEGACFSEDAGAFEHALRKSADVGPQRLTTVL